MFFFFKQKTAYEMRISDWSSDVCSSDLRHLRSAPWCAGRHASLHAVQLGQITFMTSSLGDARTEFRFIGNPAVMPDEICARQICQRPTHGNGTRKEREAAGVCDHGQDQVIKSSERHANGRAGKGSRT